VSELVSWLMIEAPETSSNPTLSAISEYANTRVSLLSVVQAGVTWLKIPPWLSTFTAVIVASV
jgi:hypothetical protein